jgi:hypothetical protein
MVPKIDAVSWGKVKVDGQIYHQVLIVGDKVIERDKPRLKMLFNTTHEIGGWEQKLLLSGQPEIILIASGFDGVLKLSSKLQIKCSKLGIELKVLLTPKAVDEYNRLVTEGVKVNALIHTTC